MPELYELGETEQIDLEIFNKFVTPHYKPSNSPKVMCVGASFVNEGMMLRNYHNETFGLNGTTKIVACNVIPYPEELARGQYDAQVNNLSLGDARTSLPYGVVNNIFNSDSLFDLVYIRNPDLVNMVNWVNIFQTGIKQIGNGGVVVTLVREDDLRKYDKLLSKLENRGFRPVLTKETGLGNYFQHTIGLFKNP